MLAGAPCSTRATMEAARRSPAAGGSTVRPGTHGVRHFSPHGLQRLTCAPGQRIGASLLLRYDLWCSTTCGCSTPLCTSSAAVPSGGDREEHVATSPDGRSSGRSLPFHPDEGRRARRYHRLRWELVKRLLSQGSRQGALMSAHVIHAHLRPSYEGQAARTALRASASGRTAVRTTACQLKQAPSPLPPPARLPASSLL